MIWKRNQDGQVSYGPDNKPVLIQKKLMMSSYRELQLYMIDNYPGMVINDNLLLFLESTLMKIIPKHIQKAGERYKQVCGCQTCIIFKDMYSCLQIWRKRFICDKQSIINSIQRSREKTRMQEDLDTCQARSVRPLACLGYCGQRYGTIPLF